MMCSHSFRLWALVVACLMATTGLPIQAQQSGVLLLRNGMRVIGNYGQIPTIDKKALAGEAGGTSIALMDDGLKRVYVHRLGMVNDFRALGNATNDIELVQPGKGQGNPIAGLGQIYGATEFNRYGRREIAIRGPKGDTVQVLQGITLLNERYAVVEALGGRPPYNWDMRLATSTFDGDTLRRIFHQIFPQDDENKRFSAVRFFIAAKRWEDAKAELIRIQKDFPNAVSDERIVSMDEQIAIQLLQEAQIRRDAGQYEFARSMLSRFPLAQFSRERRLEVSDALEADKRDLDQVQSVQKQLRQHLQQLPVDVQGRLGGFLEELKAGLSIETLDRLSDYLRLGEDEQVPLENRVALAVSGWLLGGGSGLQNIEVAASLRSVRDLVVKYLAEPSADRRDQILEQLRNLEGAQPEYVAQMLPLLTPVLSYPEQAADPSVPGMFHAFHDESSDATQQSELRYVVQLPPEYNPHRQYPCIVALHPFSGTPADQVEWWAGPYSDLIGQRKGQASRLGYVVVAPVWNRPRQKGYEFTAMEHHRVLSSLRHAMRRVSIDADRIYLVGHGQGGTAAWDIAVSHPDIWAGFVVISGEPGKTILHYNRNSEYLPSYFVFGEIDGGPVPTVRNGSVYADYLNPRSDSMIVEYRGRGREYFYEETPSIFEWMALPSHRRRPIPETLDLATMRPGDRFFWWLELREMKPGAMTDPVIWENVGRAGSIEAKINADNSIRVRSKPADAYTLWLRPDMGIDLDETIVVRGSGSTRKTLTFQRSLRTMLEDVRTRADRVRPYWASFDLP